MTVSKKFLTSFKLFFSFLGFSAVVTEIAVISERGVFNPANFFSYFTIETNILVFITFLLSALAVSAGKKSRALDVLRGLSVVSIILVGIGFAVLLSGLEGVNLTAVPWDNLVLHYIVPIAALFDFIIDSPKTKLLFKKSLSWLLFPVLYAVYSLIRGAITSWYPYPFLDPSHGGYGSVVVTMAGLLALGTVLILGVAQFSNKIHKK